jgi:hypothetical protein
MLSTSTLTVYCARGAITAETPVSRNTPELIGTRSHLIYCKSLAECTPSMKQGPFPREEERRRTKQQIIHVQLRANVALGCLAWHSLASLAQGQRRHECSALRL